MIFIGGLFFGFAALFIAVRVKAVLLEHPNGQWMPLLVFAAEDGSDSVDPAATGTAVALRRPSIYPYGEEEGGARAGVGGLSGNKGNKGGLRPTIVKSAMHER
jgi:hypothetical protein